MVRMNKIKGVTLVELLITLAIISIISSIVLPKTNIVCKYKEKAELREFKNDIVYARNMAICKSKKYFVRINFKENYYLIYTVKGVTKEYIKKKELSSGLTFKRPLDNSEKVEISFNSTGAPSNARTICLVSRYGDIYSVAVTPATGRINVYLN